MAAAKPVTVGELKTFIDAVEFAADTDDWIPSARQWKRIREMIERLEERAAPAPQVQQPQPHQPQMMVPMMVPSAMMSTMHPGAAPGQAVLPPGVPIAGANPALPVKTPDIDTSNGQYQSTFT